MENQVNVSNQNTQQIGKNAVSQPVITPEKPKANYLMFGGIVLTCFVLFGFGGYYLGKQSSNSQPYINNAQNQTNTTATLETRSPTSSPNPTNFEGGNTNTLTAWRHSTGYWLLNLPLSWSAVSFDSGPLSLIKVYAKTVSWDESHSAKDLSDVEVMTINIAVTDKELTTNNSFVWKEENGEMQSNTLILESQKGQLSFRISYPKNTNYKDQINEVLNNINFKASSKELSKAKTIP